MAVADWVYLTDTATGCSYYANLQTRETSWHRPAELDDPAAVAAAGSSSDAPAADAAAAPAEPTFVKMENGWFRYTDDASGRFYYYNKNTQKTKWSVPADALPAGEAADAPPAAPAPSSSSSAMTPREDYVSDEESEDPAPPPVPLAGYASSKSIGGDDDVDAPEENVYVRRLSGARLDSVENVGEAAAPEAQLSEEAEGASEQPPRLRILSGPDKGKTHPLVRGTNEVGRALTNQVPLEGDGISKVHAVITWDDAGVVVAAHHAQLRALARDQRHDGHARVPAAQQRDALGVLAERGRRLGGQLARRGRRARGGRRGGHQGRGRGAIGLGFFGGALGFACRGIAEH